VTFLHRTWLGKGGNLASLITTCYVEGEKERTTQLIREKETSERWKRWKRRLSTSTTGKKKRGDVRKRISKRLYEYPIGEKKRFLSKKS